jgi:hypothetical protein
VHSGIEFKIDNVLVDTGSAATIFASDYVREFGIDSEPEDKIRRVRGSLLQAPSNKSLTSRLNVTSTCKPSNVCLTLAESRIQAV